jgi:hypothetical protein
MPPLNRSDDGISASAYPVVPAGAARIRVQVLAAHSLADIDRAIAAFDAVRATIAAACTTRPPGESSGPQPAAAAVN